MNVTVVAAGSRGDVEPYLALARGLTGAGHRVTFVTTSDFVGLAAMEYTFNGLRWFWNG